MRPQDWRWWWWWRWWRVSIKPGGPTATIRLVLPCQGGPARLYVFYLQFAQPHFQRILKITKKNEKKTMEPENIGLCIHLSSAYLPSLDGISICDNPREATPASQAKHQLIYEHLVVWGGWSHDTCLAIVRRLERYCHLIGRYEPIDSFIVCTWWAEWVEAT